MPVAAIVTAAAAAAGDDDDADGVVVTAGRDFSNHDAVFADNDINITIARDRKVTGHKCCKNISSVQ